MSIPRRREKRLDLVLHSDYPPGICLKRLAEEIDVDHWTPVSLSGYKGHAAMLGRIAGNEFRLHKRKRGHNSFAPILFARVLAEERGSIVKGYWSVWPGIRLFMRVWLGLAVLIGGPMFVLTLLERVRRGFTGGGDWWIGLIVPPALVLWGLVLPRLGAAVGGSEKDSIGEFLQWVLVANKRSEPTVERNWKSVFDKL